MKISDAIGIQSVIGDSADQRDYDERMGIKSKHYLTMLKREATDWIVAKLRERIAGKVVVELGAGVGVLAVELARHARRVYAIEADPAWTWMFARHLYDAKPANLTWLFDTAENVVDLVAADVAIVVTGSDEDNLRALAARFAPDVIMPWQDWNDGVARVDWMFASNKRQLCRCLYGCPLVDDVKGIVSPGDVCQLRASGAIR